MSNSKKNWIVKGIANAPNTILMSRTEGVREGAPYAVRAAFAYDLLSKQNGRKPAFEEIAPKEDGVKKLYEMAKTAHRCEHRNSYGLHVTGFSSLLLWKKLQEK